MGDFVKLGDFARSQMYLEREMGYFSFGPLFLLLKINSLLLLFLKSLKITNLINHNYLKLTNLSKLNNQKVDFSLSK